MKNRLLLVLLAGASLGANAQTSPASDQPSRALPSPVSFTAEQDHGNIMKSTSCRFYLSIEKKIICY